MQNILVFLTDDHGAWAGGFAGNREIHSPSMDFVGRTGASFPNAFTPCPVCSPARASFWTGKIPSAHGIHDHIADPEHSGVDGQSTLAQQLQAAGYFTGLCGKWHCHARGERAQPGFDDWFSPWDGTRAVFGAQPFSQNGVRTNFYGQQAPIITDGALRFLRQHAESTSDVPFFLFVSYTDTHSPFKSLPPRLVQNYSNSAFADIPRESFSPVHGTPVVAVPGDELVFRQQLAQYYASVEMIDQQVGRILDELEGMGRMEDTMIVYTSDHGHMNGHHGLVCKGNATTPQNFLEESIRIPLLVRCPGGAPEGVSRTEMVDLCDLHATLRDFAGLALEKTNPGRSFLPGLLGKSADKGRIYQFCEYGNARMVRSQSGYKLIRRFEGPNGRFPDEFYDLNKDPRETRNCLDSPNHSDLIVEMDAAMQAFYSSYSIEGAEGPTVGDREAFNSNEPWRRQA